MTPERIAQLEQMLERGTIRKGHIVEMLDAIKQQMVPQEYAIVGLTDEEYLNLVIRNTDPLD